MAAFCLLNFPRKGLIKYVFLFFSFLFLFMWTKVQEKRPCYSICEAKGKKKQTLILKVVSCISLTVQSIYSQMDDTSSTKTPNKAVNLS